MAGSTFTDLELNFRQNFAFCGVQFCSQATPTQNRNKKSSRLSLPYSPSTIAPTSDPLPCLLHSYTRRPNQTLRPPCFLHRPSDRNRRWALCRPRSLSSSRLHTRPPLSLPLSPPFSHSTPTTKPDPVPASSPHTRGDRTRRHAPHASFPPRPPLPRHSDRSRRWACPLLLSFSSPRSPLHIPPPLCPASPRQQRPPCSRPCLLPF